MKNVAEAVASELRLAGIDRVFGIPGGEVLYLLDALRREGIDFTLCRHESSAGIMASVYGKLKRTPGLVLTTLGPGAANLMLPLSNSLLDREPLLAISAQIPFSWPTAHTHQRLPLMEAYRNVTKYSAPMDGFSARAKVKKAVEACLSEPAGSAYLTLSAEDALGESFEYNNQHSVFEKENEPDNDFKSDIDNTVADQLSNRLSKAERPLVILGIGIKQQNSIQLREWLKAWSLPVAVTPKVKGMVDERDENFVGVIGGMAIDWVMVEMLKSSDLIIGLGFDVVEVDKTWHAELPILWVLDSPMAMQVVPQKNLLFTSFASLLDDLTHKSPPRDWNDPFHDFKTKRQQVLKDASTEGFDFQRRPVGIVQALSQIMPPETIVTTDVGAHKYIFGQFWPSCVPETFFMSNGLSGMGYGLPAAIGAKLARPDSPVLAVVGDGGLTMTMGELETIKRSGVPLIVVVMSDQSLSLIRLSQESKKLTKYGVDFQPMDSVMIANAFGLDGVRVASPEELIQHICSAVRDNRPLVVEIPLDVSSYKGIV